MMGRVRQSTRSNSRCRGRNTALCAGAYAYLGRHSSSGLVAVCNCPKFYLSILLQRFPGVLFSTTVQDLGVTLDQEPTLSRHVGSVCRSCFYHLRHIRSVPRSLTSKAARTLMHSFICSRVDYCSAIYAGVALAHVDQLQSVLNAAARLIGGIPKFGHISEFIRAELHWLPMHRPLRS